MPPPPLLRVLPVVLVAAIAVAGITFLLRSDDGGVPVDVEDLTTGESGTRGRPTVVPGPHAGATADGTPALPSDRSAGEPVPMTARWIVSGQVVDATTRAPVRGAAVSIVSDRGAQNPGFTEGFEPFGPGIAATDPGGAFRLALDAGGPTTLRIEHPDWLPAFLVVDGSRTDVVVELRPGLAITGRVVTRGGAAVEGAAIAYVPRVGGARASAVDAAAGGPPLLTDRDGRFQTVVDPETPAAFQVDHPRHVRRTVRMDPAGPRELQIELTPALVAWVRLRSSDGRPVPQARVLWTSGTRSGQETLDTLSSRLDRPPPPGGGRGGGGGRLELPLDPGGTPISVRLTAPGYLPHTDEWTATSPDGDERTFEVTLARDPGAATVSLRLERADGSSLPFDPDVPLTVERTDGGTVPAFSVASDRGEAATIDGLPAGPYRFRAWLPGSGPAETDAVAIEGTTVGAVARATVEARLTLRLTGTKGRRGLVRVLSGGRATYPQVVDDPRGTAVLRRAVVSGVESTVLLLGEDGVTLGGFGAGPHRVEVVSPDLTGVPVDVDLTAGETARAEVAATIR